MVRSFWQTPAIPEEHEEVGRFVSLRFLSGFLSVTSIDKICLRFILENWSVGFH